ncbi:carboxymuconolactone decarboxylase family protein [Leptospira idonii]|uniref:Carboxymuconolactone decarboxylase family protein n=1 Tax=Leptospira idonii TaxID=1193500 RepID=A0A4R9LWD8_9LEPT|nr:carboxymuconolactone decarboxylase family protein [Leptospira idonii]TGN17393.1 carboxymuconolactone decarboxylase family protein [Leptospira idonii]
MPIRIELSEYGNTGFQKILGHNPKVTDRWNALEESLFQETELGADLLEQVRRTMAFENKCEYCMVKAGRAEISPEDKRTGLAAAFADLFVKDHLSISQSHFQILKEEFSDKEIAELCAFISFTSASQKIGRIFHLTEDYQLNRKTTMEELNLRKE